MSLKIQPLNEEQLSTLNKLIGELSESQLIWISGYLEGKLQSGNITSTKLPASTTKVQQELCIIYGTHTGRSKSIATQLQKQAEAKGIVVRSANMADYKTKALAKEQNIAIIVSTHGEGEPPETAEDFYNFLLGKRAPKLDGKSFSVLALGDKSYKHFCKTGSDIDQRLEELGANCVSPLVCCDVDYEDQAEQWINEFLASLSDNELEEDTSTNENSVIQATEYSRKNPFYATVLDKVRITGRDSDKEVYHLELSIEDSGIQYKPGDAVGIVTQNPDSLVDQLIKELNFLPDYTFTHNGNELNVQNALKHEFEITVLNRAVLQAYYDQSGNEALQAILNDEEKLDSYLYGSDLLDLVQEFPYAWTPESLFSILRKLPPRLYSISSSQLAVEDEVHITVSLVDYERKNRKRLGACSSYLSSQLEVDDQIPIYIDHNPSFKLPEEDQKIIMIGAGTGVAPYRAFLQEREASAQKGNTWLFFGDRRFNSDFLYQLEWQKLLQDKVLERLDVAFSRDQEDKVYVQHKLIENQQEIYEWLNEGACLYLCGDMKYMAKDVNKTLLEIVKTQGGISEEQAEEYIKSLKKSKRFQTDVY